MQFISNIRNNEVTKQIAEHFYLSDNATAQDGERIDGYTAVYSRSNNRSDMSGEMAKLERWLGSGLDKNDDDTKSAVESSKAGKSDEDLYDSMFW